MADDNASLALQQNVLTLLAHSAEHGKIVANLVEPELFEGDYRVIAERCIDYWRTYGQPPGTHIPDLFTDILEDPGNRRRDVIRDVLFEMLRLSESINGIFVVNDLSNFVRVQRMKVATMEAADKLAAMGAGAILQVEELWRNLLRKDDPQFQGGLRLTEVDKVFDYFERTADEFITGVEVLDQRHIVPTRGKVISFIAPSGYGKSWWLMNVAKRALLLRQKVLHISIEMDAEECAQRYYQSFFSIPKREVPVIDMTRFEFDDHGRVRGLRQEDKEPDFAFFTPEGRDEVRTRVRLKEGWFENIVIKRFPQRRLTVAQLEAYMDQLATIEGFVPDMLLIDYPGIMTTDPRNHRISLGRLFEDLMGLFLVRNVAGMVVWQSSKIGADARVVRGKHVAEDWSIIGTSHMVVTYSRTDAEARLGLARLYVDKARSEADHFGVLITQDYRIGQFCLESAYLDGYYFDNLQPKGTAADGEEEGDGDEE